MKGITGAQSVLLAKMISELLRSSITTFGWNQLANPWLLILIGGLTFTILLQTYWLNAGLEKYDSMLIFPIFQVFWIVFSVFGGIFYFDELKDMSNWQIFIIVSSLMVIIFGVVLLSHRSMESSNDSTYHETEIEAESTQSLTVQSQSPKTFPIFDRENDIISSISKHTHTKFGVISSPAVSKSCNENVPLLLQGLYLFVYLILPRFLLNYMITESWKGSLEILYLKVLNCFTDPKTPTMSSPAKYWRTNSTPDRIENFVYRAQKRAKKDATSKSPFLLAQYNESITSRNREDDLPLLSQTERKDFPIIPALKLTDAVQDKSSFLRNTDEITAIQIGQTRARNHDRDYKLPCSSKSADTRLTMFSKILSTASAIAHAEFEHESDLKRTLQRKSPQRPILSLKYDDVENVKRIAQNRGKGRETKEESISFAQRKSLQGEKKPLHYGSMEKSPSN